jgi:hypothetical protein
MSSAMVREGRSPRRRLRNVGLALGCSACPIVLALLVLYSSGTPNWSGYRVQTRGILNDEVAYWAKARAFAAAGFDSGYFTYDERAKPDALARFGAHPQIVHVAQGSIVALVGWHPLLPLFFNTLVVVGCWFAFVLLVRPARAGPLLLTALAFWPLALWLTTGMQTSLQIGIGIVAAGCVFRLNQGERIGLGLGAALVAFLLAASLARFTWALLAYPFLLSRLSPSPGSLRRHSIAAGVALVAVLASAAFYLRYTQGYPRLYASPLDAGTLLERAGWLLDRVAHNVRDLGADLAASVGADRPRARAHSSTVTAALSLVTLVLTASHAGMAAWRRKEPHFLAPAVLSVLAPVLVLTFGFYEWQYSRGDRLLVPVVGMAVFLAAAARSREPRDPERLPRRLVAAVVVVLALGLPGYWALQRGEFETRFWDEARLDESRRVERFFAKHLVWRPGENPWHNTISAHGVDDWWGAIPPGIGISLTVPVWIRNEQARGEWRPRARYYLTAGFLSARLDPEEWELLGRLPQKGLPRRSGGMVLMMRRDHSDSGIGRTPGR